MRTLTPPIQLKLTRTRFSWALYDSASTIFSLNIIYTYFALWLLVEKQCPEVCYSATLGISMLLASLALPIIGEISDTSRKRVPFLIAFTLACAGCTILLGLCQRVSQALLVFFFAHLFYQLARVIYNTLLAQVSIPFSVGRTSGLGVSLGYLGALFGLNFVKPFFDRGGSQGTFIPTAILYLVFAIPSFVFIKDIPHPHLPRAALTIKASFSRVWKYISGLYQEKAMRSFFLSVFLCLSAVNSAIVYMSVYAYKAMGFEASQVIYFMSLCTFFAIAGSYFFGSVTDRFGAQTTLGLIWKLWVLGLFLAMLSIRQWMFWIAGPLLGICLGATWVSARALIVELSPPERLGQMFGLFGLVERLSAITGLLAWGIAVNLLGRGLGPIKYRSALGLLLLFMLWGYSFFQKAAPVLKQNKVSLENLGGL
ncbi:MAG: MFS transporter [Candidatus Omnitrophota bacterium]